MKSPILTYSDQAGSLGATGPRLSGVVGLGQRDLLRRHHLSIHSDEFNVYIELAAIDIQKRLLIGDQLIADCYVLGGGIAGRWGWAFGGECGGAIGAAAGDNAYIDVEHAAIGVQQRLLISDQPIPHLHISHRLRRNPRRPDEPQPRRQHQHRNPNPRPTTSQRLPHPRHPTPSPPPQPHPPTRWL